MRLSEAIRLGSLTIQEPKQGDIDACAITMALNSVGFNGLDWERYVEIGRQWPWTAKSAFTCPFCDKSTYAVTIGGSKYGASMLYHPFDHHVMTGDITIEQFADWIASIEPPDPKPMPSEEYDRGLAITRCHGE